MGEFAEAGGRETLLAASLVMDLGRDFKLILAPGVIFVARFGLGDSIERPNAVITHRLSRFSRGLPSA